MITLVHKYIEGRQRRGFESKAELQETDFRREIRIAFKAQEKRQNLDNDALFGQPSNLERQISATKKSRFPTVKRAMLKKMSKLEMHDRPWRNGSLATLMDRM